MVPKNIRACAAAFQPLDREQLVTIRRTVAIIPETLASRRSSTILDPAQQTPHPSAS